MYFAVAVVAIVSLVLMLTGCYLSYNWLVMFLLLILWYCASATFWFQLRGLLFVSSYPRLRLWGSYVYRVVRSCLQLWGS